MHRLFVAPGQLAAEILLQPEQVHYLRDVLRLQPGASLEVFDGAGGRWHAILRTPGAVTLGEKVADRPRVVDVVVAQALAKGEKMELVIQKCTELGASRFVPFAAERSVVRLDDERGRDKAARWQRIAQEAARQCGRADVPQVDAPTGFDGLLSFAHDRRALVLAPDAEQRLGAAALGAERLLIAIGPEGGFSLDELARAEQAGFTRVGLGPLVLRTETAALAALAVIQHVAGELG